jgi:hypothetical protein
MTSVVDTLHRSFRTDAVTLVARALASESVLQADTGSFASEAR